jgi:AcrR family transcriptional regulator
MTVEAICERADVARRTFFNYFHCREHALVANDLDDLDELRVAMSARPVGEPPLAMLRTVLRDRAVAAATGTRGTQAATQLRLVLGNPALMPYQLASFAETEQILADGLAQHLRVSPTHPRPAALAGVAATVMRVATQCWLADPTHPLEEVILDVFDIVAEEHRCLIVASGSE